MEHKIKHLEMLEHIIDRLGKNSFQLKGWAVTLVAIIGAWSANGTDKRFFILTIIPLIAFWLLDSYYLQVERKYIELYNRVRMKREEEIDFDMNISGFETKGTQYCFWECVFSKTERYFYGAITIAVLVLAFILKVW